MKYKHYILTRFNLGLFSDDNPYAKTVGDPQKWLEHRIPLFTECVKSLKRQTNQNYEWIIAFDPLTEMEHEDYGLITVVYEQPHVWLRRQPQEADWIITSRIDNDDMYFPGFVDAIQNNFRTQEEIIDIDYEVLDSATGNRYPSLRTRPNSPFLSLVEPWGKDIMTAMGRPHTMMPDLYPARKLGVYAFQVVHEMNVLNKIPI